MFVKSVDKEILVLYNVFVIIKEEKHNGKFVSQTHLQKIQTFFQKGIYKSEFMW